MKVLLDENLPHALRHELPGHDVFTVAFMGWKGVANGELLRLAAAEGFEVLVTNDRGVEHEQNPSTLPLAVIVILPKANTIEAIRPMCAEILATLSRIGPCQFVKLAPP